MTQTRAEEAAQRLLDAIPGNASYNSLEALRDADRAVRQQTIDAITAAINGIEVTGASYAQERRFTVVQALEQTAQRFRFARDKVRALDYGYGSLFSAQAIDADAVERLRKFDSGLVTSVADLVTRSSKVATVSEADAGVIAEAESLTAEIDAFLSKLSERALLLGVEQPAAKPSISTLLSQSASAANMPDALASLEVGSAVAIENANFVIDAMIIFNGSPRLSRLWRLQRQPEQWLMSAQVNGTYQVLQLSAATTELTDSGAAVWTETGEATLKTLNSSATEPAVTLSVAPVGDDSSNVSVTIAWSDHRQSLSGPEIPLTSISVFGQTRSS